MSYYLLTRSIMSALPYISYSISYSLYCLKKIIDKGLIIHYYPSSSNIGFLKLTLRCFRVNYKIELRTLHTASPWPLFNLFGPKSNYNPSFFVSIITFCEAVVGSSYLFHPTTCTLFTLKSHWTKLRNKKCDI